METYRSIIRDRLKEIRKEWSKADDIRELAIQQVASAKLAVKEYTNQMRELTKEKNILKKRLETKK